MPAASAVLDASVLVRAGVEKTESARTWIEAVEERQTRGLAPDLVWMEVASALRTYVTTGALERAKAFAILSAIAQLPIGVHSSRSLAGPALHRALELGLSVYDASYVALADAASAVLVTADRRLAEAAQRAELVV